MADILKKICENKKNELEITKKKCSLESLKKLLSEKIIKRNFKKDIIESSLSNKNFLIGEIKKASPSAGEIIKKYDPLAIAKTYQNSGVRGISILTEKKYFEGDIDHLSLIKQNTNIPILRKDFIIDEYQIYESKIYQADVILLIVSVLNDNQLKEYIKIANEIKLDCIVETHNEEEIKRALKLNYPIIGINNRNLKNLETDIGNSVKLFKNISKDYTVIAESGIKTFKDIQMYNDLGIFSFLIGESILRSNNYKNFIKNLLGNG